MKANSILWFLKRPQFIPQAFSIFFRKFYVKKENTREEAILWCEKKSLSSKEAFNVLFSEVIFLPFHQDQEHIYLKGKQAETNCNVKMGGAGDLDFLYNLTLQLKPLKVIETGVAYGWSSLSILSALKKNNKGLLISTDMPYMHKNNEAYVGCVIPEELRDKWRLIREADITGLNKALKEFNREIDFCHYDSDKSYLGRKWAYPILWDALVSSGFLISDDIQDNIAFKEFSEKVNVIPIIIYSQKKYVGILRKP